MNAPTHSHCVVHRARLAPPHRGQADAAAPSAALLAPGQAAQLAFDIVEPSPGVVAFDFRFE